MVGGGRVCTLQGLYSLSEPYCGRGVVREAKRVQFPPCVAQSNARGGLERGAVRSLCGSLSIPRPKPSREPSYKGGGKSEGAHCVRSELVPFRSLGLG